MERRSFLKSALAGGVVSRTAAARDSLPRRTYQGETKLSVIGFGGIVVMGMEQKDADNIVAESIDRGVNYFDVAPSYGDGEAEQKLGIALKPHRPKVFLACKTGMRDAAGAERELNHSLQRLHTDHFDLYQFHAVTTMKDVEEILAPGGAGELFLKARDQGKVRHVGFSAHSVEAALALLDRFPADSVLFPTNFVCFAQGNFGPQVIERAKEKGVARLALKALAYSKLPKGAPKKYPKCWYQPVDDRNLARQALRFTLSQEITAAIPPGDERFYRMALNFAAAFKPLTSAEQKKLFARTQGVEPIFQA